MGEVCLANFKKHNKKRTS